MDANNEQQPKILEFDGAKYDIEALTPRVSEGVGFLLKLQNEIREYAYQLRVREAAAAGFSGEIKANIKDDKIKPITTEASGNSSGAN